MTVEVVSLITNIQICLWNKLGIDFSDHALFQADVALTGPVRQQVRELKTSYKPGGRLSQRSLPSVATVQNVLLHNLWRLLV